MTWTFSLAAPARGCQRDWEHPACVLRDDMQPIFESVLSADLLLLASPIYSWYCTAPLKAALDRMVYAMNKYYGDQGRGPSLWRGRAVAAVTTCGYRPERGADLWEEGLRRYCKQLAAALARDAQRAPPRLQRAVHGR